LHHLLLLCLPCGTEVEKQERGRGNGRSYAGTFARAQQAFYFEKRSFSRITGEELINSSPQEQVVSSQEPIVNELGITFRSDYYHYLTHTTQTMAFIQVIAEEPKEMCLRNYVGAVFVNSKNNEFQRVVCSSKQPVEGMIPNPIVKDGKLLCSPDTIQVE
jgi:Type IV pilin-like G and H, putative